jgi:hypothetical protein
MTDSNGTIDCVTMIQQCYVHHKIQTKLWGMTINQIPKKDKAKKEDRFGIPGLSY